jgi:large subunit ribosomal protein L6
MSRLGKIPLEIPSGVDVKQGGGKVIVKGPLGELTLGLPPRVSITIDGKKLQLQRAGEGRLDKSMHGLARKLVLNMLIGVTQGYSKDLELWGLGYKAVAQGQKLVLTLGFSSPVEFDIPVGVKLAVVPGPEKEKTTISLKSVDKQKVGEVAAEIRACYPMEPYKGKGIKYKGEYVRRKEGKTVA